MLSSEAVAFAVNEEDQGSDLNGDGRLMGSVLHVRDFAAGTTTNLGLSVFELVVGDGAVAFAVNEEHQDADLNGDGLVAGHVAHLYDLGTGTTTNLGLRVSPFALPRLQAFALSGRWLALRGMEGGVDHNSDGDGSDTILYLLDRTTGALVSQRVALVTDPFDDHLQFSPDGWLSFRVSEAGEGRDLDGDCDLLDWPVQYLFPATGARIDPQGQAVVGLPGFAGRQPYRAKDGRLRVLRPRS